MKNRKVILITFLLFFLFCGALAAENLRGRVAGIIDLSQDSQTAAEHELKIGELLALSPGSKGDFLSGIQVSIRFPDELRTYGESFVLMLYKRITPAVTREGFQYQGLEAGNMILPSRPRVYLELPLGGRTATEPLNAPLTVTELPLLLNIINMSKAAPMAIESSSFMVKVTPVWSNTGKVEFFLSGDSINPADIKMWIDDRAVVFPPNPIFLAPGIHTVRAQAPGSREVSKSFGVNQAQTVRVELPFSRQQPALYFEAPEGTQIFLDGEKINP